MKQIMPLFLLSLVWLAGCGSDSSTLLQLNTPPTVAPGTVVYAFSFDYDEDTVVEDLEVMDGSLYDVTGGGSVLIQALYDPNFWADNYTVSGEWIYRVDGADQYAVLQSMSEGFETITHARQMIGITQGWTFMTLQDTNTPEVADYVALFADIYAGTGDFVLNTIAPSTVHAHTGTQSLKFYSAAPDATMVTAKASLDTGLIHFAKGEHIWYQGWYYVESGTPFGWFDFECSMIEGYPGMRLLVDASGEPRLEVKWGDKPTYRTTAGQTIPTGQWTEITVHLFLSDGTDGVSEMWIDGTKVIDATGRTLPIPQAVYNNLEIGITATPNEAVLYMDDVYLNTEAPAGF